MVIVFPAVTRLVIDEVLTQRRAVRLTPLVLIAALALVTQPGLDRFCWSKYALAKSQRLEAIEAGSEEILASLHGDE